MVPLAASQPNYLAEIEVSEPGRTGNSLGWGERRRRRAAMLGLPLVMGKTGEHGFPSALS